MIVLDPFMGSGSTAIACLNLNRYYIGIEKEDKYIEKINSRIAQDKSNQISREQKNKRLTMNIISLVWNYPRELRLLCNYCLVYMCFLNCCDFDHCTSLILNVTIFYVIKHIVPYFYVGFAE